jgi:predicted dehydrogenase
MTIKTILIGVGGRGWWPVEVLGADPRYQPVALVDKNPDFLKAAQRQLDLPDSALFDDLKDALSAVDCDAVVICTPTHTHASLARTAFAAG